ncbi:hypothetical protein F7732_05870 [Bacillus mesophilum]|uniref:Uncharacterized protein n=1 Tax=Bacillus mesophilum TaxID=1071718 RepID=A0A7V7RMN6_9BACI|nr:hypothetical protein F7732_05870 [Bacillus mesophilum]
MGNRGKGETPQERKRRGGSASSPRKARVRSAMERASFNSSIHDNEYLNFSPSIIVFLASFGILYPVFIELINLCYNSIYAVFQGGI